VTVAAVVAGGFVALQAAGGSGYLGAFIAGVIAGNVATFGLHRAEHHEQQLATFTHLATSVVVLLVFITLGANLPLRALWDDLLPGLAVIATLVLVARPLAVLVCLLPDRRGRWTWPEIGFVAWARETGVVPAAVAATLAAEGVAHEHEIFTAVALAIMVTLLVQSTTKPWLARRLRLAGDLA
jgi:cell volume regulation protein A